MRRLAVVVLLSTALTLPARAQVGYDTPQGRVEVLGLNHWTLQQLRDSLKAKRPGLELEDAACIAVLRNDLHFADALVSEISYQARQGDPVRHVMMIKLVEPEDRARVQWRAVRHDSARLVRPEYAPIVVGATDTSGALWPGRIVSPLSLYSTDSAQRELVLANAPPQRRDDAHRLWGFLDAHRGEADWRRATHVLASDPSYANRVVAVTILSGFADRDSSWYALVEALRDPNELVRIAATVVLNSYPRRVIDWAPEAQTLRYLLGGTNVEASEQVFSLLAFSGVRPALAPALVRDNMQWIGMHLRSSNAPSARAARELLTQLNAGRDLGADPAEWMRWSERLEGR